MCYPHVVLYLACFLFFVADFFSSSLSTWVHHSSLPHSPTPLQQLSLETMMRTFTHQGWCPSSASVPSSHMKWRKTFLPSIKSSGKKSYPSLFYLYCTEFICVSYWQPTLPTASFVFCIFIYLFSGFHLAVQQYCQYDLELEWTSTTCIYPVGLHTINFIQTSNSLSLILTSVCHLHQGPDTSTGRAELPEESEGNGDVWCRHAHCPGMCQKVVPNITSEHYCLLIGNKNLIDILKVLWYEIFLVHVEHCTVDIGDFLEMWTCLVLTCV